MSKKFLSESQVRRFQGLAGIPSIHQEAGYFGDRDEDELPGDEGPGEELPPELAGGEEELAVADLDMPEEGGEELELDLSPEQKENLAADIVRAVADELEQALSLDEPIEVDVEELPGEELPMGLEEPPLGGAEGEELELGAPEAEEELEEPLQEDKTTSDRQLKEDEEEEELAEVVDDEAVVNEVFRRVVARLSGK